MFWDNAAVDKLIDDVSASLGCSTRAAAPGLQTRSVSRLSAQASALLPAPLVSRPPSAPQHYPNFKQHWAKYTTKVSGGGEEMPCQSLCFA